MSSVGISFQEHSKIFSFYVHKKYCS